MSRSFPVLLLFLMIPGMALARDDAPSWAPPAGVHDITDEHPCQHKLQLARQAVVQGAVEVDDRGYDVDHYDLSIEVGDRVVSGTAVMTASATAGPLTEVVIDLYDNLDVTAVGSTSHGVASTSRGDNLLTVHLAAPVAVADTFDVSITYDGSPASEGGGDLR